MLNKCFYRGSRTVSLFLFPYLLVIHFESARFLMSMCNFCALLLDYCNTVFAPSCVSCLLLAGEKKKPVKPATGTPSPKLNGQWCLLQLRRPLPPPTITFSLLSQGLTAPNESGSPLPIQTASTLW